MASDKAKNGMSHIGIGTRLEGKIAVPHELSIYGEFYGEIICESKLTLGSKSKVKANISAKHVVIGGTIEGEIICPGTIELEESAVLIGNITTKELIINKGAKFHGASSMLKRDTPQSTAKDAGNTQKIDVEL